MHLGKVRTSKASRAATLVAMTIARSHVRPLAVQLDELMKFSPSNPTEIAALHLFASIKSALERGDEEQLKTWARATHSYAPDAAKALPSIPYLGRKEHRTLLLEAARAIILEFSTAQLAVDALYDCVQAWCHEPRDSAIAFEVFAMRLEPTLNRLRLDDNTDAAQWAVEALVAYGMARDPAWKWIRSRKEP